MPPKPQLNALWKCSVCGAPVRCKAPTGNVLDAWVPIRHRNRATGEDFCMGCYEDAVEYTPEVQSE